MSIRVVLADDQDLVRAGLAMIVESQDDLTVVGEAADGAGAIDAVRKTSPDVVLMDVRMPGMDGIQATAQILRYPDAPRVLMLTTLDIDEHSFAALRAGASGFLLKSAQAEDVVARSVQYTAAMPSSRRARRGGSWTRWRPRCPGRSGFPRRCPGSPTGSGRSCWRSPRAPRTPRSLIGSSCRRPRSRRTSGVCSSKLGLRDRVQVVVLAYESGLVRPER